MIRTAVIGSGMLVQEILPVLTDMPEIDIRILTGTERSKSVLTDLQTKYAIPEISTDYEAMLQEKKGQLDLVYLATPNHTHYEMAKKALEAGYNVLIEKPLVLDSKEAEELFSIAKKKGVIALEAISNQYLPVFEILKQNLSRVGQIKYVSLNFSQYSSRYDRFMAGEYFRVFDASFGGGALTDLGIYNIHIAAGLFGAPAKTVYYPNILKGVDTSGVMIMDYTDFKVVSVGAKDCQGDSGLMIEGTDGILTLTAPPNSMNAPLIFHDRKTGADTVLSKVYDEHRMAAEFREIAGIIQKNDVIQVEGRQNESLLVLRIMCEGRKA